MTKGINVLDSETWMEIAIGDPECAVRAIVGGWMNMVSQKKSFLPFVVVLRKAKGCGDLVGMNFTTWFEKHRSHQPPPVSSPSPCWVGKRGTSFEVGSLGLTAWTVTSSFHSIPFPLLVAMNSNCTGVPFRGPSRSSSSPGRQSLPLFRWE